jgi:eukaryotic-like serine/threonine-protein kinase
MVWQPGKKLKNGQYTIESVLGQGGFGITYLARDLNSRQVAIKTLNDAIQNDPNFPKLHDDFQKEAKRLYQCAHPNIVKIYDLFLEENLFLGVFSNGKPLLCMVMEYIRGNNLWEVVETCGALPEAKALKYIKQVCEVLKFIHTKNILHRDIKPNNIMVKSNETIVLIDFGIARDFVQDKTQMQTILGTPGFSPPEQLVEQARRGAYTDIYALAATLYFLLTGIPPQPSISSKLKPPKELNSSISHRIDKAIVKAMKWRPEDRPQSVEEWMQMLISRKELAPKQQLKPVVKSPYAKLATDKKPLTWVAISLIFWAFVSWMLLSLVVPEKPKFRNLYELELANCSKRNEKVYVK